MKSCITFEELEIYVNYAHVQFGPPYEEAETVQFYYADSHYNVYVYLQYTLYDIISLISVPADAFHQLLDMYEQDIIFARLSGDPITVMIVNYET